MSDVKIREIVESDIENGFLESLDNLRTASNLNRETAVDILKKIIRNPDQAEKWSNRGIKRADFFSMQRLAEIYLNTYKDILS